MRAGAAFVAAALAAAPAAAQSPCSVRAPAADSVWSAPFDRIVSLHDGTVTLPAALERITAAARLRVSYSRDLLPAAASVCLEFDDAPLGAVLAHVLRGTSLTAVAAGRTHIVLAPAVALVDPPAPEATPVITLGPLHVEDAARAPAPVGTAPASVSGGELGSRRALSLADALDAAVPGIWLWRQQGGVLAQSGSIRGASAFGAAPPKLMIDGVEVANPALVTHVDPANVERIDVVRGPHGSTLYGADAGSGVINIITLRGAGGAEPGVSVRSAFGMTAHPLTGNAALLQQHTVGVRGASEQGSARVDVGFAGDAAASSFGAAQRIFADIGASRSAGPILLSGGLRYISETTGSTPTTVNDAQPERVLTLDQYSLSLTAGLPTARWSHALVLGVDGYLLAGAPTLTDAVSPADSALAAAGLTGARTTLRLTSGARTQLAPRMAGGIMLTAQHTSMSRENLGVTPVDQDDPAASAARARGGLSATQQRAASGIGATVDLEFADRLAMSAGLRVERSGITSSHRQTAVLPVAGASLAAVHGAVDITVRAAYGRGLSWPQLLHPQDIAGVALAEIAPELQAGLEAGVDIAGGPGRLQLTRFRQASSGVMQYVPSHSGAVGDAPFTLQNVGGVNSTGWEIGASAHRGPITAAAALTLIDSRVSLVSDSYTGDLTVGDRVLGVPGRTLGARIGWSGARWDASLAASRATGWINYDRAAIAEAADAGNAPAGPELRAYWLDYDGLTHLGASVARRIGMRALVHIDAANLLDHRIGEPDNITLVPGRTLSAGIRITF